jgi:biotin carboxylase
MSRTEDISKKVLLLGSSFSALPILNYLQSQNYHVTVYGDQISDPCISRADAYELANYSNSANVLEYVKKQKFSYVVPSCNDIAFWTASIVAEVFSLPGFDPVESIGRLHLKNNFRELCKRLNINVPDFINFDATKNLQAQLEGLDFPLLLKPTNQFSGIDIFKIRSIDELERLCETREKWTDYLVEHFIEGTLHSHSAFVRNRAISCEFFVDEYCKVYDYQVDCSNHPSRLSTFSREIVSQQILKLIQSMKLVDGLIHTQFIVDKNNEIYLIETMRRCPGDLFPQLIKLSTGFDYISEYTNPFIGKKISQEDQLQNNKPIIRHTVSTREDKNFVSIASSYNDYLNLKIYPLKTPGTHLAAAPLDKAAILFMEVKSEEELFKIAPGIDTFISVCD